MLLKIQTKFYFLFVNVIVFNIIGKIRMPINRHNTYKSIGLVDVQMGMNMTYVDHKLDILMYEMFKAMS